MPNSSLTNKIEHQRLQQAASWFALLADGNASRQEHSDFELWLRSKENQQAWSVVDGVSQQFSNIRHSDHHSEALNSLGSPEKIRQARRSTLKLLSLLPISAFSAWSTYKYTPLGPILQASLANYVHDYATDIGKISHVTLLDKTQVSLNTASAINVKFNQYLRLIDLARGEIFIDTAKDIRPFEIQTPTARLRALGTRFNVRLLDNDNVQLTVLTGRVAIYRPTNKQATHWQDESQAEQVVEVGQQVIISAHSVKLLDKKNVQRIGWHQGLLLADEITLAEFIDQLGRYRKGYLAVSPDIAHLRIMGSFPLNNTDKALAMLSNSLPVKVNNILPWWVSLEPK